MCKVPLCSRKALPDTNRCDGHQRQLIERVLKRPEITESEARAMDGNR